MVKMRKKGILFSLGLMLLTLVILALAILIFHSAQKSEEIIAKLAVLDRVYDLDRSIGKGLSDIFYLKSGISISRTNNGVSFEEMLPNDKRVALNSSLHHFKQFVEHNLSNVNLSITNIDEMPLMVMFMTNNRIDYKHKEDWSDIEVLPKTGSVPNGYFIFIKTDRNVTCTPNFDGGGFNLSWEVKGDAQSCPYTSQKIAPANDKMLSINSPQDGNIMIIKVESDYKLLINLTKDISVRARTTIYVNQPKYIVVDSLGLYIDFMDFGISKESGVMLI